MGASSSKNRSPRQTPRKSRTTIIDRTTSRDRTTRRATSTRQQRHVRKRRETPHKGDHTAAGDNREETNIDLDKFKDLVNQVFDLQEKFMNLLEKTVDITAISKVKEYKGEIQDIDIEASYEAKNKFIHEKKSYIKKMDELLTKLDSFKNVEEVSTTINRFRKTYERTLKSADQLVNLPRYMI